MTSNPGSSHTEDSVKKTKVKAVAFTSLFRYSSPFDKLLIAIGVIVSVLNGSGLPAIMILRGRISNTFVVYDIYHQMTRWSNASQFYSKHLFNITNTTQFLDILQRDFFDNKMDLKSIQIRLKLNEEMFVEELNETAFHGSKTYETEFTSEAFRSSCLMIGIGICFMVSSYIMVTAFITAANNQTHRIRILYFESILRQDITWFDTKTSGDFATKVTADLDKIESGIGDKVAMCIFFISLSLCSLGTALYFGWELTLVILAFSPVMIYSSRLVAKVQAKYTTTESDSYSKAGAVAEEVLGAVRTVYTFDGQSKEVKRYEQSLKSAKKSGIRRSLLSGLGEGMNWFCAYTAFGLAFWYGVRLIVRSIEDNNNNYDTAVLLTVLYCSLNSTVGIGQTAPLFEAFAQARGAAALIFDVIQRKPEIDSSSDAGRRLQDLKGRVELRNAHFNYPSRPDVTVLNGLNLMAEPGKTVALVGPSGCGKSTVVQLIQRFYDLKEGQVLIDGIDVKELNVGWLRDNIGVVGQEPVLFGCSIEENIKLGYSEASNKDVESAAIDANAFDFIQRLPHQFYTLVGEGGSQLSGGQKQRIAIARALVRKPKILLLDESTSALDTQSESIVQAALDRARVGRTTFIVAHRLSTIRSADKIIVINNGRVEETGSHEELMKSEGLYHKLVKTQQTVDDFKEGDNHLIDNHNKKPLSRDNSIEGENVDEFGGDDRKMSFGTEDNDNSSTSSLLRLLGLLKPDKYLAIFGCLMALLMGLTIPAYALIFAQIMGNLSDPSTDHLKESSLFYALLFLAIGVISFVISVLLNSIFGICGERLTMRLRRMVFTAMLNQEVAWFDDQRNSTGALCARLSSDTASIQGASGTRMSTLIKVLTTLSAGIVMALIYSWKLGLVMSSFIPLIIASTYFHMRVIIGQSVDDKKALESASQIGVEAISSIRTVVSLHREKSFLDIYTKALKNPFKKSKIRAHLRGITFGFAYSMAHNSYAFAFLYGSYLIVNDGLFYGTLFRCCESIIFATQMVGTALAFAPDYQKGRLAAIQIFKLLDRMPKIVVNQLTGDKPQTCEGNVRFSGIEFTYPTRRNAKILRSINFEVSKGQTVALVGSSGCGKSTIIQLIQRFYDCDAGEVILDNRNIVNLNIPWLRSKLGIVSQEPVLFDYSIAENIAYGDNSRSVAMNEIIRAAEKANIHSFITSLPMGYETHVGDKGTQLSGGQKQRIAIARALVRNPQILLLDEATSALDSESEKLVQQALDEAREGRTCLVIAHRLSTIHNADKIVVIHKGKVVEEGNHQNLMSKRGVYFDLNNVQNVSN